MPKQITKQYDRVKVDDYHDKLRYLVKLPGHWPHHDILIQEFLDQENSAELEVSEFEDFREAWITARYAGIDVGMTQSLNAHELRVFARLLYTSEARRRYYLGIINGKLRCNSSEEVKPISAVELEQRYQHYLYKKERDFLGLGYGPRFEKWLEDPDCPAKQPFSN